MKVGSSWNSAGSAIILPEHFDEGSDLRVLDDDRTGLFMLALSDWSRVMASSPHGPPAINIAVEPDIATDRLHLAVVIIKYHFTVGRATKEADPLFHRLSPFA